MKVLVTGANGFIGANLVRSLILRHYDVRSLVRPGSNCSNLDGLDLEIAYGDVRDTPSLETALMGCEGLFHVAAFYAFWSPDPDSFDAINVKGTENVIRTAARKGVKKIVYTSSECTLKLDGAGSPGNEQCCLAEPRDLPVGYKRSKCAAEHLVWNLIQEGLPVIIVNPTAPVGPYDIKPTPTGKIIVDYLNGKMPAYVDAGLNLVSVEDVAEGHVSAMEKGRIGKRYILGNENLTLNEIFKKLENLTGVKAPRVKIPIWAALAASYVDEIINWRLLHRQPGVPMAAVQSARRIRYFDCSQAILELDFSPSPVETALDKAIGWFRLNGYLKAGKRSGKVGKTHAVADQG